MSNFSPCTQPVLYGGGAPLLDGLPALEDADGSGGDQSMDTEPLSWRLSARQRTTAQDEPVFSSTPLRPPPTSPLQTPPAAAAVRARVSTHEPTHDISKQRAWQQ
jgi:hypothetical protein